jgi:CMP-2-keto-3-deoxyoctulosonic acid synthetase
MEHGPFGVDTAEDLERARALLALSPRPPRSAQP